MSAITNPTAQKPLNILSIGGSRNIGYYASLKLLQCGSTVTFLLRHGASSFASSPEIQPFIASGHARLVQGDALVKADVARAWIEALQASQDSRVDYLLFTVGGTPKFSLTKGFIINPHNLVTVSLLNVLSTIPPSITAPPRILTISSLGVTPPSHASLPVLLKPLYGHFLAGPHADKLGSERVLHHVTRGWSWHPSMDNKHLDEIMPEGWMGMEGLPKENELSDVIILRPSMFTDGESVAEKLAKEGKLGKKEPYRVAVEEELSGYTISRKDVAHFVVELVLRRWDEFNNKVVNISY